MGYDRADWFLSWYVDDFFDTNDQQEDFVDRALTRQLKWHRASELPKYQQLLKTVLQKSEQGVTVQDVQWLYGEANQLRIDLVERLFPDVVDFLLMLDAEQVSYLDEQLQESNEDLEERAALSQEERDALRLERFEENFEEWFEEVTPEQKQLAKEWISQIPDTTVLRLENRKQQQRDFISFLKTTPSRPEIQQTLKPRFLFPEDFQLSAYFQVRQEIQKISPALVVKFDQSLTVEQRQYATEQIQELIEVLEELKAS